jgi:hypothetical protein
MMSLSAFKNSAFSPILYWGFGVQEFGIMSFGIQSVNQIGLCWDAVVEIIDVVVIVGANRKWI